MGAWGWAALGVLAALGVYAVATRKKEPEVTGHCLADMPEPFKKQATDIIKAGDVARMNSFAAQSDAKGWHCAAKELRTMAKKTICDAGRKAGEAAGTGDIGNAMRPHKQSGKYSDDKDEQKDFDRCFYEGYESKWKMGEKKEGCPDDAYVTSVVAQIALGTMSVADAEKLDADYRARFMLGSPDYAKCGPLPVKWDLIRSAIGEKKASAGGGGVVTIPFLRRQPTPAPPVPADPFAILPGDIKSAVQLAYDSGDPQQLDDVASDYLVPYPDAWKKVKDDAKAMRGDWTAPLSDITVGTSRIRLAAHDIVDKWPEAAWLIDNWYSEWPTLMAKDTRVLFWASFRGGNDIANALVARGFKTAANQLGHLFADSGQVHPDNIDAWYPLP